MLPQKNHFQSTQNLSKIYEDLHKPKISRPKAHDSHLAIVQVLLLLLQLLCDALRFSSPFY
jgi:hypothetical protein